MEMSPTSRNTLKIGAALILIALLLVCGPIADRMGLRGGSVEEAPSVATGPPVDPIDTSDAVEAVAAGALVGASIEETDVAALGDVETGDVKTEDASSVVAAGVVAGAAGAAAGAGAAGSSGTGGAGPLPPVSAGVPPATDVASGGLSEAAAAAAATAEAFEKLLDSAMANASAGRPAARFAPPVAAAGVGESFASTIETFRIEGGDLLRPCDSPGSGCQNLNAGGGNIGGGAITPFGPGSPRGPR